MINGYLQRVFPEDVPRSSARTALYFIIVDRISIVPNQLAALAFIDAHVARGLAAPQPFE
jgi:hypothetical protein